MGRLKQLLPLGDKTVIKWCLDAIIAAEMDDVVVVLGSGQKKLMESINDYPVTLAVNEDAGSDMAESVRVGLSATEVCSTGIMVCLSDHPLVVPETLKLLAGTHSREPKSIIIPVCSGKRGHPALFPKDVIQEVFAGVNLREIIQRDPKRVKLVKVNDEGVIMDMDTKEEYLAIIRKIGVPDVEGL
jgi:molybdenum cofactor cytidylyltransferase